MTSDLFEAIEQHDLQGLEGLLAAGEDPNQVRAEWVRLRPLHAAIIALDEGGSVDAITVLLQHGADINLTYPDVGGGTPLLTALFNRRADAVEILLEAGADPNVVGEEGDSPLRWAVAEGDHELAAHLLSRGADRTINGFGGIEGLTALGIAAGRLDACMVGLLLTAGAARSAVDLDGQVAAERMPLRTLANGQAWDKVFAMLSG